MRDMFRRRDGWPPSPRLRYGLVILDPERGSRKGRPQNGGPLVLAPGRTMSYGSVSWPLTWTRIRGARPGKCGHLPHAIVDAERRYLGGSSDYGRFADARPRSRSCRDVEPLALPYVKSVKFGDALAEVRTEAYGGVCVG